MPRGGNSKFYDDDDLEDYEEWDYEEEAEDEEEGWEAHAEPAPAPPEPSKLAHGLCDAPPLLHGKLQSGAKKEPEATKQRQQPFPLAPYDPISAQQKQSQQQQPYDFADYSPDDLVSLAQQGKLQQGHSTGPYKAQNMQAPTPKPPSSFQPAKLIHLPQSKAMLKHNPPAQQQQQSQQQQQGSVDAAATSMAGLQMGDREPAASTSTFASTSASTSTSEAAAHEAVQRVCARRRMGEYRIEPELERECAAAASQELSEPSSSGSDHQGHTLRKPGLHLVVLGHVDAGKSTLMGRLLFELGHVTQKDVHRNQRDAAVAGKASFSWAWVLDERPEERARGVTVDVATTRFQTPKFAVTLLDAPGHRDFVSNMIGGAAAADAALLLVDGSYGGFEAGFEVGEGSSGGGQTREHAQLARSLGVEQLAVVVSKLDTVDNPQERFEHVRSTLAPFLHSTCGFRPPSVQWLPAVGPSGQNLVSPPSEPVLAAWWQGVSLVQAIDAFKPRERLTGKPVRVPVSDVFKNKAGALVVGGKVEAGAFKVGMKLLFVPGQAVGTVRSMEVGGQSTQLARAGDAAEIAFTGLDTASLPSGAVLCHPDFPVPLATKFELRVVVLEVAIPVLKGQSATLHAHVAREVGHVSALLALLSPKTGEVTKNKPRCLLKGQTALIEVTCPRGMCLEEYSDLKSFGRIALRDGGKTLAVGVVTRLLA